MGNVDNNLTSFPVDSTDRKKTVPAKPIPVTDKSAETENVSVNTVEDKGAFSNLNEDKKLNSASVSFVEENAQGSSIEIKTPNLTNSLDDFQADLNLAFKEAKVTPDKANNIYQMQVHLKELILQSKLDNPADINRLKNTLSSLMIELNSLGNSNPKAQTDLKNLTTFVLEKIGKNSGIDLKPEIHENRIIGLRSANKKPLTKDQKAVLDSAKGLCLELEKVKVEKGKLTPEKIFLIGVRSELLNLRFERLTHVRHDMVSPEPIKKDLQIIKDKIAEVDKMLENTKDIDQTKLTDLESKIGKVLSADKGKIEEALNDVKLTPDLDKKINDSLNTIKNKIQELDKYNKEKVPELLKDVSDLKGLISKSGLPDIDKALNQVKKLEDQLNKSGKDLDKSFKDLSNTLGSALKNNNIPVDNKDISKTSQINKANNTLINVVKRMPHNTAGDVKKVVGSYTAGSNTLQSVLPPFLPKPYTLKSPLTFDDGSGNKFTLPPGSTISKTGGNYMVSAPSLLMASGGNIISAGQTNINLGKNIDSLSFSQLDIHNGGTDVSITNMQGQVNKQNGSSFFKADQANIDFTNGSVVLTNASMIQNPDGSLQLGSDKFHYDKGGNHADLSEFKFGQTEKNGVSNITGSATTINLNINNNVITADKLSFNMTKDKNNNTDTANITAENLNAVAGGNTIKAAKATLNVVTNSDGSSTTVFNALNPSVTTKEGGQLDITGNTTLTLNQDTSGNLKDMTAKADNLKYTDKNGVLNATDGNLKINYDPQGNVDSLNASAKSVDFAGKDQKIAATNGNVTLNYGDNNLLTSAAASADTFKYGGNGESLDVTGGNLNINFDKNGFISDATGKADNLSFNGKNGDIVNAKGLDISLTAKNNEITAIGVKAGQLDYTNSKGDKLNITNGTANIVRDEQGFIKQAAGTAENLSYNAANGDKINASGLDVNIIGGKNGITDATIKAGKLDYLSKNGDKINVTNGFVNIKRDDAGFITEATGKADKLALTTVKGDDLKVEGLEVKVTGGKNGLQNLSAKAANVDYLNAKGDKLNIVNGSLDITKNDNGAITNAVGKAGSLSFSSAAGEKINATGLEININGGDNGITDASIKAGKLDYLGKKGEKLDLTNGNLNITRDPEGFISKATATVENLNYQGVNGDKVKASGLDIVLTGDKNGIQSAAVKAGLIDYTNTKGDILNITNSSANITRDPEGFINSITAKAENLSYKGAKGDSITVKDLDIAITSGKNGLEKAVLNAGKIDYISNKGDKLNINNGTATLERDAEGFISKATATADNFTYNPINGDTIKGSGIDISITGDKNGLNQASVKVGSLDYLSKKGDKLNLINGSLNITKDPEGFISNLNGKASNLTYNGVNGDKAYVQGLEININGNVNGITDANVKAGELLYTSKNNETVHVLNGSATIFRDDKGLINKAVGSAEKLILTGKNGDTVNATGVNVELKLDCEKYDLSGSAKKIEANIKKENLNINATGVTANMTNTQIKVHVDSAEFIKKVEEQLNDPTKKDKGVTIKVENVDLLVDKNEQGGIKGIDVQVEGVQGKVQGMDIMVKTENGDRVRLNMKMSDDGKLLKEAFLQIPNGGEVKIKKDDLDVTLGAQMIKFTQDGNGLYTLRDEGLKADVLTKDAEIHVQGGVAQVSLDTTKGNIIIDEITGTKINANFGKDKKDSAEINIEEIKGFLVKASGLSGDVKGIMVELKPTGEDSKMTMSIKANIQGIPVGADFKDVHELRLLGTMKTNEVHVYAGDPSGKGEVSFNAGPLKMYGSAVEVMARYHTFDGQRMMSSMSRYLSNDGIRKGAFSVEPDGIIRLEKQSSGLHLGAAVALPRSWENKYAFTGNQPDSNASVDFLVSVGGQGKTNEGTKIVAKAFTGAVSSTYVSVDQSKGSASLYNIPITRNNRIPTTVVGGLGFSVEGDKSRVGASVGAFVNPVGFVKESPNLMLQEQVQGGGFAGFNYRTEDHQLNLDGLVGVKKDKTLNPGFRVGYDHFF